jgi:broad specificity phosphatase PhoE
LKGEVDVFISSSMKRALETAKEIGKTIKKKPKILPELSEFNKILWEGKFYHPKFWKHYFKHKLTLKTFDKILEENKGKVIVIVAHGNVIKGIIGKKLGLSRKNIGLLDMHNCHISLLRFIGKKLDYVPYINSKVRMKRY